MRAIRNDDECAAHSFRIQGFLELSRLLYRNRFIAVTVDQEKRWRTSGYKVDGDAALRASSK